MGVSWILPLRDPVPEQLREMQEHPWVSGYPATGSLAVRVAVSVSRLTFVQQGVPWDPSGSTYAVVHHTRINSRIMHNQYSSDIRIFPPDSPRVIPFNSPRSLGIASASGSVFCT